jgi:hypothetical protein
MPKSVIPLGCGDPRLRGRIPGVDKGWQNEGAELATQTVETFCSKVRNRLVEEVKMWLISQG